MRYFLGADLGSSKTHVAISDEAGHVVGFGRSGPANHQTVGFEAVLHAVQEGLDQALAQSGISLDRIAGSGFGIAGYDWPSEGLLLAETLDKLDLPCPYRMVNDAVPALFAGARNSRGVGLVSGTGCNCRGWDPENQREGRVTGFGSRMGEFAGASELVWRAMQLVANEWTRRGPPTALSGALVEYVHAEDLEDLIEGYTRYRYHIDSEAALLIFEVARQGDQVARDLIAWAGSELGEMAKAVIKQLEFETQEFDVVLTGSMFEGGSMLIEPMWQTISSYAPGARLVQLSTQPVGGAVILGMETAGHTVTDEIRNNLSRSLNAILKAGKTPN